MIAFDCCHCGSSVWVSANLIGPFTRCAACESSVPVPLADITARAAARSIEPAWTEPGPLAVPRRDEPSPFAALDGTGGSTLVLKRAPEDDHGLFGLEAFGLAVAALVLAFLPGCNVLAPILALGALVFSIDGICSCTASGAGVRGMGFSIAGILLSVLVGGCWGLMLLNAMKQSVLR